MKRSLLALALAGAAVFAPAAQAGPLPQITPGCDNPVDVVCNEGYCPGEACTPIICGVWLNGRCVL